MGSSAKGEDWISLYASALTNASKKLSSPGQLNGFSLFDSSPYCAKSKGDSADDEEGDQGETKWDKNWKKNTDLIFKDRSSSLVTIPEVSFYFVLSLHFTILNPFRPFFLAHHPPPDSSL